MVHEPVDGRQRHGLVGENLAPFAEGLVGRDEQGSAFVAGSNQLEQNTGFGLILGEARSSSLSDDSRARGRQRDLLGPPQAITGKQGDC